MPIIYNTIKRISITNAIVAMGIRRIEHWRNQSCWYMWEKYICINYLPFRQRATNAQEKYEAMSIDFLCKEGIIEKWHINTYLQVRRRIEENNVIGVNWYYLCGGCFLLLQLFGMICVTDEGVLVSGDDLCDKFSNVD